MKKTDFTVIIPDRKDRQEFLEHCMFQIKQQTLQPDQIIIVDYHAEDDYDLTARIKVGIRQSRNDKVYIIENDDYYHDMYFEVMQDIDADLVGIADSLYYHIGIKKYKHMYHLKRSSLYCTGFKISKVSQVINAVSDNDIKLDLKLWHNLTGLIKTKLISHVDLNNKIIAIGIKHASGLCGGSGHRSNFYQDKHSVSDDDFRFLKAMTRKKSFQFYKQWHTKIRSDFVNQ